MPPQSKNQRGSRLFRGCTPFETPDHKGLLYFVTRKPPAAATKCDVFCRQPGHTPGPVWQVLTYPGKRRVSSCPGPGSPAPEMRSAASGQSGYAPQPLSAYPWPPPQPTRHTCITQPCESATHCCRCMRTFLFLLTGAPLSSYPAKPADKGSDSRGPHPGASTAGKPLFSPAMPCHPMSK